MSDDGPTDGMTGVPEPEGHDSSCCGGRKRDGSGDHCRRPAGWGTDHPGIGYCKLHGGSTPNHVVSAQKEIARRAVVTYGLPREVAPDVALLEEVHRTAGAVAYLGAKVAELDEDQVVWNLTEETDKTATEFPGIDRTSKAVPNVWVVLYQQERKHLTDVCKAALAAGIAERQVKLAEAHGALLAGAIQQILGRLDLSDTQRQLVPVVVPEVLRAIQTGAA